MTADQYPITTPYGQVPGYPLHNHFHQGVDYGCPVGTPVVVNGVTIGLSGNTGYTFGPHLHLGKWSGGVVQNPLNGGFDFKDAQVTGVEEDSENGKYVRIQGDGFSWVYLHLSSQNVKVGDKLKGASVTDIPTSTQVGEEFQALAERQPTQKEVDLFVGLNWFDGQKQYLWPGVAETQQKVRNLEKERTSLYDFQNSIAASLGLPIGSTLDECLKAIEALKSGFTPVTEQLYKKG